MHRRDVLQFLGAAMLSPLLAPLSAEERWRTGTRLHQGAAGPQAGAGLSAGHLALVSALADTLIPRTDTPGALDVGVPAFVDRLVAGWYPDAQRAEIVAGLDIIDVRSVAIAGAPVVGLDAGGRARVLTELDRRTSPADAAQAAWRRLREAIVYGYVTAQPVAVLLARTPIIPGRFDGCVPVGGAP